MYQRLLTALRFLVWPMLIGLILVQCKKSDDPSSVTPTTPGTQVDSLRTGAKLLDRSAYEALPLLKEPLVGARVAADGKDPNLPASYDLTPNMPPVGDQGQEGSCTAWAVAYAARSYYSKVSKGASYTTTDGKRNDEAVLSPAFVYNQINKGVDRGSYPGDALDLLQTKGVCTLKDMPYKEGDYKLQPTTDQQQKASVFKIKKWGRVTIDAKAFKRWLYLDYPIMVTAGVDALYYGVPGRVNGEYVWKSPKATNIHFHAMVIMGYDDSRKAFKVQNSWGKDWANQGYIWLDYDSMPNVILEAYVMVTGESGPTPTIPVIQTGSYQWSGTTLTLSGTIKELNNAAISRYGFQVATSEAALAAAPYQEVKQPITSIPFPFTLAYSGNNKDTYYYRAFAETPEEFWYGGTLSAPQPTVIKNPPVVTDNCRYAGFVSNQATVTGELTSLGDATSFADHGFIFVQNSVRQKDTNPDIATAPRTSLGPVSAIGPFSSTVNNLQASMPYKSYTYVKTGPGVEYSTYSIYNSSTGCNYITTPSITYSGNATVHSVSLPQGASISGGTGTFVPKNSTLYVYGYSNAIYQWKEGDKQAIVLAGSGKVGSADGVGIAASFNGDVVTMASDASGNIYIAENYKYTAQTGGAHQKIRKITPDGVVTSLAGNTSTSQTIPAFSDGKGEQASFQQLIAMTADMQGNLWVVDGTTVRKVTPDGVVTTLCGDPNTATYQDGSLSTARFYKPTLIAVDNAGTLFVVDKNSIRKIMSSGVTTLAGQTVINNAIPYISPGRNVYGAYPTTAHYIDGSTPTVDFFWPIALLPDNNGNLYIVDRVQTQTFVRKLTPSGQVTTIAGKPFGTTNTVPEGGSASSAYFQNIGAAFMGSGYIILIDDVSSQYRLIQSL